jgi:hypothetical protein
LLLMGWIVSFFTLFIYGGKFWNFSISEIFRDLI